MEQASLSIQKFCRDLMDLLPRVIRGFVRHEHDYLISGRISPPQFWVLDFLYRNGACPMKALSQYLKISKPAATALIDRLIEQGLVLRQKEGRDRRVVMAVLSASGKRLTAAIINKRKKILGTVFGKISENDRRQYLKILRAIERVLSEDNLKEEK